MLATILNQPDPFESNDPIKQLGPLLDRPQGLSSLRDWPGPLTLAKLYVFILRRFIDKAPTKFNEALAKPYHSLIEVFYKLNTDIIVNDYTTKKIMKS